MAGEKHAEAPRLDTRWPGKGCCSGCLINVASKGDTPLPFGVRKEAPQSWHSEEVAGVLVSGGRSMSESEYEVETPKTNPAETTTSGRT